jgi:bifunctional non-homologous end joining protein LigD
LIKHKDKYASQTDITEKAKSVMSGKTLEQIEKAMTGKNGTAKKATKSSNGQATPKKPVAKKASAAKKTVAKSKSTVAGKKKVRAR